MNFIVSCGNFGSPYKGYSSPKSSATHSYQCVQYFCVSRQWRSCHCRGFLTCTQMLMYAIAHGGCADTGRESAPEVDSGRKIPCRTGDSNPRQYCAWHFSRTLYQLSYPVPQMWLRVEFCSFPFFFFLVDPGHANKGTGDFWV